MGVFFPQKQRLSGLWDVSGIAAQFYSNEWEYAAILDSAHRQFLNLIYNYGQPL